MLKDDVEILCTARSILGRYGITCTHLVVQVLKLNDGHSSSRKSWRFLILQNKIPTTIISLNLKGDKVARTKGRSGRCPSTIVAISHPSEKTRPNNPFLNLKGEKVTKTKRAIQALVRLYKTQLVVFRLNTSDSVRLTELVYANKTQWNALQSSPPGFWNFFCTVSHSVFSWLGTMATLPPTKREIRKNCVIKHDVYDAKSRSVEVALQSSLTEPQTGAKGVRSEIPFNGRAFVVDNILTPQECLV